MDWSFQSVKYLHELVQQYGGGVKKQISKKEFEKNEHYGGSSRAWVSDCTASPYLKVAGQIWKIQSSSKLREFRK